MYPLKEKVSSYLKINDAKFGSRREAGKRLHAGCDLYCVEGSEVYAMFDGVVWEYVPSFYAGTSAIGIIHNDKIVSYCEIKIATHIKPNVKVKEGEVIGWVKKCQGIKQAMLHLELYTNSKRRDSLTDRNEGASLFKRRSDLFEPTAFLEEQEVKK